MTQTSLEATSSNASTPHLGRVCAVVVTFNRQTLLQHCLRALLSQSYPVDHILVVDNASTDGTPQMLCDTFPQEQFPQVELLALNRNLGGAGGFHAGFKRAFEAGYDWLWVMDDDGIPAPDCLEQLMAHAEPGAVLVPLQQDTRTHDFYGAFRWQTANATVDTGPYANATDEVLEGKQAVQSNFLFTFVGPLIHRRVVEKIGLPHPNFFIYFDDIEFALRIQEQQAAKVWVVPGALFAHDFGGNEKTYKVLGRTSIRKAHPSWKVYYETRNYLYTVTRTRRSLSETLRCLMYFARWIPGELVYEPDRWRRLQMRVRGLRDGATGRMGKRVPPR